MNQKSKNNISRRSFIFGGSAAFCLAGLSLSSCNSRKTSDNPNWDGEILASISYVTSDLCPIGASNATTLSCVWHCYEGLYNIDYTDYDIYNGLAAKEPTMIDDLTYEVILRDEAYFSNGQKVTVNDVVNSFKANMDNTMYSPFLTFIKNIEAKDKKTIRFLLKYPFKSLFKTRISLVKIFPANVGKNELNAKTIGSGPWVVKYFNPNDNKIDFELNPFYQGKFAPNGKTMKWNLELDEQKRIDTMKNKETYLCEIINDNNSKAIRDCGANIDFVQGFNCAILCFNTFKPPFDNHRIRRAVYYDLDIEKMIDKVLGGKATVASSFLPKNHKNYNKSQFAYDHNPDKVNELLKDEKYEYRDIKILVNSNWVKDLAPLIKEDLDAIEVGCQIDVAQIDWKSFDKAGSMGDYDIVITPGDPSVFSNDPDLLMSYWYGDNAWMNTYSGWKITNHQIWTRLDATLQNARETTNISEQQKLWNQAMNTISEYCPIIPMFHREIGSAYMPNCLNNYQAISTTGLFLLGASAK